MAKSTSDETDDPLEGRLLVSAAQAAHMLSISQARVYVLLDRLELESVYIGRRRLIPADSLREFVAGLPTRPPSSTTTHA